MGPRILPETTVGKSQSAVTYANAKLKLYHARIKCIKCEHGPESPSCPVGQGSFKMDCRKSVLWSDESKFDILVGNHRRCVLRAKEEGYLPACHQASLIGWGCISAYGMGSLHVLEGTMNSERYIKVLEQHILPSRQCLFQGRPCVFQQENHILQLLQQHGFESLGAELAYLQSRAFTYRETFGASLNEK